jgi:hypothetical protein
MTPIRQLVVKERSYLPHLLAIGLLWALVMTMEYHDQAAAEADRAERMTAMMADCLNGKWVGITPSGERIGCMPAETLTTAQVSK